MTAMPIIGKFEARRLGLKRYFTGRPCIAGHLSERIVLNERCVECATLRSRELRARNRKVSNEKAREYHRKNSERIYARNRERYQENIEEKRLQKRVYQSLRRSRLVAAEGAYTNADVEKMLTSQGNKCVYCLIPFSKRPYHVDHIMPVSRGGSNYPSNLQLLCASCNSKKKDRDPVEFVQSMGHLV